MKLLTKEIRLALPPLYATESVPLIDKVAICKFFTPWTNWTWYAVEGESSVDKNGAENFHFFGFIKGPEPELGYFSLAELEACQGPFRLKIERDRHFFNTPLREVIDPSLLDRAYKKSA